MRRTVCLLAAVLLVLPSLGSDAPKEDEGAAVRDDLQGTWQVVGRENDGNDIGPEDSQLTFLPSERYQWDSEKRPGTYRIDASREPAHLDLTRIGRYGPVTQKCIFWRNGDTLRIACRTKEGERPKDFREHKLLVYTYRLVMQ